MVCIFKKIGPLADP